MTDTPKGFRRHIAIAGRRNAGKSSLFNALLGQPMSIVSLLPGTTTDPVEKTMEMGEVGPIVLIDTAGLDDDGDLGDLRIQKSWQSLAKADLVLLVTDGASWEPDDASLYALLENKRLPVLIVRNKIDQAGDLKNPADLPADAPVIEVSATTGAGLDKLRKAITAQLNAASQADKKLLDGLIKAGELVLLVVPLDSGAPKGRLILPQVQTLRECLDKQALAMLCADTQFRDSFRKLAAKPALIICDSQVVREVAKISPEDVPMTTFSVLMANMKGDLDLFASGARKLRELKTSDRVLIMEACSHHPQKDDIGRIKIPALLQKYANAKLDFDFCAGRDLYEINKKYAAIVHCGACMLTPRQMRNRQILSAELDIPMTNYGIAISLAQGVLERVLRPFPEALATFLEGGSQTEDV